MHLPVARRDIVTETHFGITVEDPYRWMEDWKGEELQNWLKAQGAYSEAYLRALPERDALLKRITELDDISPHLSSFQVAGGRYFYLRRDPGEGVAKLVVRISLDAPEQLLFDPNTLKDEVHTSLDWYVPSQNGQCVAYGLSYGGSEESTLYVLEVESGKTLDLTISRTQFANVNWLEDHRSFVYNRFPKQPADAPEMERYCDSQVYLHRLGNDPEQDPVVFGAGVSAGVEISRQDFPFLFTTPLCDWVMGLIMHGAKKEVTLYTAPRTILAEPTVGTWILIAGIEDMVTGFAALGDTIYLRTHKDAPRSKIIATSLMEPDLANASIVVPEGKMVLENRRGDDAALLTIAGDYLLTLDLDGGIHHFRRVKISSGEVEQVPLPFAGTVISFVNEPGSPTVLMQMTNWTTSPRIYLYNSSQETIQDTGWIRPSPLDFSNIEAHEMRAPAKDGALISISIIHRRGLALDGNHPTLLTGYGSYGLSMMPFFLGPLLAWFERGGVYAIAHIRGGGEYGEGWHTDGQKLKKQNTIDDFIICAEYLITKKYTRPERLAGLGTSAGGIPSGGALVQRPELWAAMLMRSAVINMVRFEFSENGPPNIPEFGSVSTEEGFRGLLIMDSYIKVKEGVNYPAVLLTVGLNDPRVVIWHATKMAARLQAATASGRPVLLRVELQAGHGFGSTKQQLEERMADEMAFLLQQMQVS